MNIATNKSIRNIGSEMWFQIALIIVLFLLTTFDRNQPTFQWHEVLFFLNYIGAALLINYWLLPRYFYHSKYPHFVIGLVLIITGVILIEELVLEKLFFPDTRGSHFPGVVYTLVEVLPIILLMVGLKFAWDAHKKQSELNKLKNAVAESQLQFLNSQINPHFLFNNLNNLYAYAIENSPKTPTIILELSSLLRYMLYDCKARLVPLEKEVSSLTDFVRLQELQVEDRGQITFNVQGELSGKYIAPLILIVFIENCFKHSTCSQTSGIRIDIELVVHGQQLHMTCTNTFSETSNRDQLANGIGLENVMARLDLLYPDAHTLVAGAEGDLYRVELDLLLHNTN